jgi:hypothetical protein
MRPNLLLAFFCAAGFAQTQDASAGAQDVHSIHSIVAAAYESISGPAGQARDWRRLQSLFRNDARLIMVEVAPDKSAKANVMDLGAFQAGFKQFLGNDPFYEKEVSSRVERFGHIAHVLSVYESRRAPGDRKPFLRGVNSFQLFNDGARWWIQTLFWQDEGSDRIPPDLLSRP